MKNALSAAALRERLLRHCREFLRRTEGQDLLEYALLAALISLVSVTAVGALGTAVADVFQTIADQLAQP
jgi:Flp pilus assembly pilin Flp